ncbi:MAG: DNA recombination protein RmuC [Lewinellaceae bacterium]|nr:DNA recombination protein RmuC [Phaeodactylibacter sp.]MCB9040455.1 DNA recombination protein RmuC [Lewinellaceae bacterium]
MPEHLILPLLTLLIGLLLGGLLGWLLARLRQQTSLIPKADVEQKYVSTALYQQLQEQNDLHLGDLHEKEEELRILSGRLAGQEQVILNLESRLDTQKEELAKMQEQARIEFENLANRLLEEKSQKFTLQNQEQLQHILAPLRDKIKAFEDGVERRFLEETKDRVSLKKEIEHLRGLNQQLSADANNLASALKGDNKTQGDWGEMQLELILEKAGLQKGIHYQAQPSFSDNGKQKRPDFVINLPEGKHLVLDSKVSLTAYERFCQAEEKKARQLHIKAHIDSIRQHVKSLSSKNYQQLYQIHSPDYLLLFIPIEPAFALAVQQDERLFVDALDQNIVIVSTSTLLATMRTVSYIWKQEKQKRSVLEIARQSGMLYDKFVNFVEDLKGIGQRLEQAQGAYHDAMNKLVDSKKYGDTLVGRAERIRELGARTSKKLPKGMVETARERKEEEE